MKSRNTHLVPVLIYTALLCVIYDLEIVPVWDYMGFTGELSIIGAFLALIMTVPVSFIVPVERNAKAYILISCFYLFFIPTAIYISLSGQGTENFLIYIAAVLTLVLFSSINIRFPEVGQLHDQIMVGGALSLVVLAVGLQAAYGGLENFNLDIERVYEFRRETASNLPTIFAYVYSNVSSVLLPFVMVLAYIKKKYLHLTAAIVLTLLLFGMSHHKSVLFGPPVAIVLYVAFSNPRFFRYFPHVFLTIPIIALMEVGYTRSFGEYGDLAYLTSLVVRRVLFVPAMLDAKYIEFFSVNPYFYWSSSRLFSWVGDSHYNMGAPFIIGFEYFSDLDTSANTGIFGSGYSNAGAIGVILYSAVSGMIISFLNAMGHRSGHAFVAAVSFITVFNIITSTDLLTSFLTHGLLLLIIVLMASSATLARIRAEGGSAR